MKYTHEELQARVNRGVTWLNKHVRKWESKVDAPSLNLHFPYECVCGQIEGDFYRFLFLRDISSDEADELGFWLSNGNAASYARLTKIWQAAILDRQARLE